MVKSTGQESHRNIIQELFLLKEFWPEETFVLEENVSENEVTNHLFNDFLRELVEVAAIFEIVYSVIRVEVLHIDCDIVD